MIDSMAQWAQIATGEIRYKPDREKVFQELFDHMADSKDYYVEHGLSQPQASAKAVAQMGNAQETARELGKIYRSVWYYIAKVTWVFVLIDIIIMCFVGLCYFTDIRWRGSIPPNFEPLPCPYPVVSEFCPNQTVEQDGYTMTATQVMTYEKDEKLGIDIYLNITFQDVYLQNPQFVHHLSLVDNLGNTYLSTYDVPEPHEDNLRINYCNTSPLSGQCLLYCEGLPPGTVPVAIVYNCGGITWSLPLEVSP